MLMGSQRKEGSGAAPGRCEVLAVFRGGVPGKSRGFFHMKKWYFCVFLPVRIAGKNFLEMKKKFHTALLWLNFSPCCWG